MPTSLIRGMGAWPLGEGPLGHAPADALEGATEQEPVEALYFDPLTRSYLQNEDLSMVAGSAPIQRAAHLLMPVGSLPATVSSGLDVESIKRASPEARAKAIEDALRRAWKTLLEASLIAIGRITVSDRAGWSGEFDVQVKDLVTKETATLSGKVN